MNLRIANESDFLFQVASLCRESSVGHDGVWQVAPFFCSIPHTANALPRLEDLREKLRSEFPLLIEYGEKRARKAFVDGIDTVTKPSYSKRLYNYLDLEIDQISNIEKISSKEPYSSGLAFTIFEPRDIIKRQRPGYVPCIVGGSFILHERELQLNVFFRSQSILEMGIFDLIFLKNLQQDFFSVFEKQKKAPKGCSIGSMNIFFSRVFIHRRLVKRNKNFIRRDEIVDPWIESVRQSLELEQLSQNMV